MARCSTGSFLAAQELSPLNRANQSKVVCLFARSDRKPKCRRLGLPLQTRVRFVSLPLSNEALEVLATSLTEEERYPTEEFWTVHHRCWGHETLHLMLKGRLELESLSGRTVEAVRQEVQAAAECAARSAPRGAPPRGGV